MSKHDKPRRRIMRSFKINEISAVDHPAQTQAKMTIMKRDDGFNKGQATLTTSREGHAHLIELTDFDGIPRTAGMTTWVDEHQHPWIMTEDGTIVIGEAESHDHEPSVTSKRGAMEKMPAPENADTVGDNPGNKGDAMSGTKKTDDAAAQLKALQTQTEDLTKKLAASEAFGKLTDAERAYYLKLDDKAKEDFLAKSNDDRSAILAEIAKAAADENPVVYTANDGAVYRKSDDSRLVSMAKKQDEDRKALIKSEGLRKDAEYRKRAATELTHLPGDEPTHVALLKAVDTIEDQPIRDAATAVLKAQNAKMAPAFTTVGAGNEPVEKGEAGDELEKLAKAHATEKDVDYYTAYEAVSKARPDLLAKALGG